MPNNTKVIRDPIYNLISFDKKEEKAIIDIINTPEFQRLRRIRQLGFSYYTYPTSTHDRLSHSLGVAFIVGELFNSLNVPDKIKIPELDEEGNPISVQVKKSQLRLIVKLAGILHDIGHGPFSHAFERITKVDHEKMSEKIISSEELNISKILSSFKDDVLNKYAQKWIIDILNGTFKPIWVKELISSQLDADRIDYLLRDAYMCGVNYASFDIKWLFQNIEIGKIKSEDRDGLLINAQKGIHAVEAFIVSRYHMYEQVYFHKTTRGFEIVIQRIFDKIKELIETSKSENLFLDENLPNFIKDNNNLNAYLQLDDFYLITHFKYWKNISINETLTKLCEIIIDRIPLKMINEKANENLWETKTIVKLSELLGDKMNFYFEDEYNNVPYKDSYLLGKKTPERAEHIWLKLSNGQKELAEISPIINNLRNKDLKKRRAYILSEYKPLIEEIL